MPERLVALLVVLSLLLAHPLHAQDTPVRVDVFLQQDLQTGQSQVFFLDPLSGLSTVLNVESGRNFSVVGDGVIYEKAQTGAIMLAHADGILEPHPFIRRGVDTAAVRWAVSPDGQAIGWVLVSQSGVSQAFVAWADGRDQRQLPISTPTPPLELYPLALTDGMALFFYDAAHTPAADPYDVFAHLAGYNVQGDAFFPLSGEPNCPCAAAISPDGRIYARLEADGGSGPFALHLWDLPTGAEIRIPPPEVSLAYAGDLILNRSGTLAAYSAANDPQAALSALLVVDAALQTQTVALDPGPDRYRPLAFIDGDTALLLAGADGTYKLDLTTGDLRHVSPARYLGTVGG